MRVFFSTVHDRDPWFRQTPGDDGVWEDCVFGFDDADGAADWLVVCDRPREGVKTRIPWERRVLFVTEPPECARYPAAYLDQFGTVIAAAPVPRCKGRLLRQQPALPWHYGIDRHDSAKRAMTWRELAASTKKSKDISVICSDKRSTWQQRRRLEFVERLRLRLGRRIDVYGRNIVDFADKADAIAPYRYHIVLENNTLDDFWTEKLADAFLGESYPIIAGGGNIGAYFDRGSFSVIDIRDANRAIDLIEHLIVSNTWAENIDLIRASKMRVMHEHNLFAVVTGLIARADARTRSRPRLDAPESVSPPKKRPKIVRQFAKWKSKISARVVG